MVSVLFCCVVLHEIDLEALCFVHYLAYARSTNV